MCNDAHPGFALFARVSAYGRNSSRQRTTTKKEKKNTNPNKVCRHGYGAQTSQEEEEEEDYKESYKP